MLTRLARPLNTMVAKRWLPPVLVGVVTLLAIGAFVLNALRVSGWDPTFFVGFGVDAPDTLAYGRGALGDVSVRAEYGHDGKFFFIQAVDPLYLNPEENAAYLDHPIYRAQRMLYPTLASGFGLLPVSLIPWSMLFVNVLALSLGAVGTARLAVVLAGSPLWGFAFPLNLGLIFEFTIDGSGVVAFAAVVWALLAIVEDHPLGATAAFVAAVLAREVMMVAALGAAAWEWERRRKLKWQWLLVPGLAALLWGGYTRSRLGELDAAGETVRGIDFPLKGLLESIALWEGRLLSQLVGWFCVTVLLAFSLRWLRNRTLLSWSAIGFVPLGFMLSKEVWWNFFDISRALAPLLTIWILIAFARLGDPSTLLLPSSTPAQVPEEALGGT